MKKTIRSFLMLALATVTAVSFAACGSTANKAATSAESSAATDKVVYKVGAEPTFPPFDTTDKDGNMVGLDMDMMDRIAELEGFEVEYVNLGFDALIPSLQSGNIDIIASGMNSLNEERRNAVDFSDTYFDSGLVLAVAEGNNDIKGTDDLTPDMKVAAQIGTSAADTIQEWASQGKIGQAVILNGVNECMLQLNNGDVAAVLNDKPVTEAYILKQPGTIKIVGETLDEEAYAIAVQKGNKELLDKINDGLKQLKESGELDKMIEGMNDKYASAE